MAWRAPAATWTNWPAHLAGALPRDLPRHAGPRLLASGARSPQAEYTLAFYAQLAADLFEQLGIARAHWVGTSMGGAIGTVCAGGLVQPQLKGRIRSLVLNDNAPRLAPAAVERIKQLRRQPAGLRHDGASWKPSSARSTSPTAG